MIPQEIFNFEISFNCEKNSTQLTEPFKKTHKLQGTTTFLVFSVSGILLLVSSVLLVFICL